MPIDEESILALAALVDDHDQRIARLEDGAPDDGGGQDDADEPGEDPLDAYVQHLIDTYDMGDEVSNWRAIPAFVAELDALRRAHDYAYSSEAGAFEQVYYHDALARVRGRLTEHRSRNHKKRALNRDGAMPATARA
jgi:hypothetical protein